jgi:3-methylfumaryl-CoA hydratase
VRTTREQLTEWSAFVGRTERRTQLLDIESLRRFAVACGLEADVETAMPVIAHWAWFLSATPDSQIDVDGHSRRGGFMPPVTMPRRMFASSLMRFDSPLELGAPAALQTTIANLTHKRGRSGDLVFVDVDRVITQHEKVRVLERQTIVYCDTGERQALPLADPDAMQSAHWIPGPVSLFRFSAVTFNAHRIHYDHDYASGEGYPTLVVHGPFTAVKLAERAVAHAARPLASFECKALAPIFVNQPVRFSTGPEAGEFLAIRCDGVPAMTAKVRYK